VFDFLPWVLTAAACFAATPWIAEGEAPRLLEVLSRTLAPLVLPPLIALFFGDSRFRPSPIRDRALNHWSFLAPLTTLTALAVGRLPAFLASQFPDLPLFVAIAASTAVGFAAVGATLAGERFALRRDGRFEPPPIAPRIRVAALTLAFPVVLTFAIDALCWIPAFRIYYESYAAIQVAVFAAAGLLLLAGLPALVKCGVSTRELPAGELRDAFDGVARTMGVRVRSYVVVNTHNLVSNAALVGGLGSRTVILTDRLLQEHPPRELLAIVGHELGHARAKHMTLFALVVLAPSLWILCVPDSALESVNPWIAASLGALALALFFRFVFGPVARLCEHDADVHGAIVAGSDEPIRSSLERICGLDGRAKRSWRHPSVEARSRFLLDAALDVNVANRPRRILGRVRAAAAVVLAGGVVAFGCQRLDDLPRERVAAAIRAGAYERAVALAKGSSDPEMAEWSRLAATAASTGVAGPDTVRERARAAFVRGSYDKAASLGRVVSLRTGLGSDAQFAAVAAAAAEGQLDRAAEALAGPASFLRRDPLTAAAAERLLDAAASQPARAPGTATRRMGT
jgi:Zn-dependent protease with chaperone function